MSGLPSLHVVILAAGQGTRMRSALPKVLHPLAGRPMLGHVIDTAQALRPEAIHVVYGHGGARVRDALADAPANWVEQSEQLGTGHAVMQALPRIPDAAAVLVLYGDVPLVQPETLTALVTSAVDSAGIGILTVDLPDPTGYGRILREASGSVTGIVEEKDATPEQRRIRETNTGMMAAPAGLLRTLLARCDNGNAQGEYYLTDVVALAVDASAAVSAVQATDPDEVAGVNNRVQLARCEAALRRRRAEALMLSGVTLLDPARIDIRGTLRCAPDVQIDINCVFEGTVSIGAGARIGPGCVLRNCTVAEDVTIDAYSVIDGADVGEGAQVGPFARLRPGTVMATGSKAGNFVELKKATIGARSKVNHLSYVGDAVLGEDVNVGAGTITCNYDGVHKHQTRIGDGAFIGSDTQLVAPVEIAPGTVVGAGTTVTEDTERDSLVLSRARQTSVPNWAARRRGRDDTSGH